MRHIKLFEDYSEEEINDLIGDLEGIGHKHRLVKGTDYGFGPNLDKENNGKEVMYLTPETVKILSDEKFILGSGTFNTKKWEGLWRNSWYLNKQLFAWPSLLIETPPNSQIYLFDSNNGREFPTGHRYGDSRFISAKKVKSTYEAIENQIKNIKIR
jgi:hypothetical protein